MSKNTIVIVCCYGIADKKYTEATHFNGLRQYAAGVAGYLAAFPEHQTIILCGGFTEPSVNISEAESFKILLEPLLQVLNVTSKIFLEQDSLSTVENLYFAKLLVEKKQLLDSDTQIVVVCDTFRVQKVHWLAKKVFAQRHCTVMGLLRRDTHPNSSHAFQMIALQDLKMRWPVYARELK